MTVLAHESNSGNRRFEYRKVALMGHPPSVFESSQSLHSGVCISPAPLSGLPCSAAAALSGWPPPLSAQHLSLQPLLHPVTGMWSEHRGFH